MLRQVRGDAGPLLVAQQASGLPGHGRLLSPTISAETKAIGKGFETVSNAKEEW
jgi:hypothetical protein